LGCFTRTSTAFPHANQISPHLFVRLTVRRAMIQLHSCIKQTEKKRKEKKATTKIKARRKRKPEQKNFIHSSKP
jgi:hypothetical protein